MRGGLRLDEFVVVWCRGFFDLDFHSKCWILQKKKKELMDVVLGWGRVVFFSPSIRKFIKYSIWVQERKLCFFFPLSRYCNGWWWRIGLWLL